MHVCVTISVLGVVHVCRGLELMPGVFLKSLFLVLHIQTGSLAETRVCHSASSGEPPSSREPLLLLPRHQMARAPSCPPGFSTDPGDLNPHACIVSGYPHESPQPFSFIDSC